MPSPPLKSLPPWQLALVGAIALVAAGAIVANGLIGRSRNQQEIVEWTNAQAVPTVTLAKLTRGDAEQKLILPGDIQPYGRATVYSRVNGYLKSWNTAIGAHVKMNDMFTPIQGPSP